LRIKNFSNAEVGQINKNLIIEAIFTDKHDKTPPKTPPFSHNLVYLSEKAGLEIDEETLELLEEVSDFNLEARYPDQKFSFHKKCTMAFTEKKLYEIARLKKWLIQRLTSSI